MPDVLNLPPTYFQVFFLILMRVASVVMTMPVLSSRNIPAPAKIGLSAILAFVLTPTLADQMPRVPIAMPTFVLAIAQEVLLGLAFAFVVQIVFSGIQMAGQVLGIQMGFNIASTFDPVSNAGQVSYIDQLYGLLAGMVFLTINGHHWVLQALQTSFSIVPVGQFQLNQAVSDDVVSLVAQALIISIRIGLPIAAALLLTDVAFLIIGRTAPQMNIFMVGQPVKIGVGLIAFFLAMPVMVVGDVGGLPRPQRRPDRPAASGARLARGRRAHRVGDAEATRRSAQARPVGALGRGQRGRSAAARDPLRALLGRQPGRRPGRDAARLADEPEPARPDRRRRDRGAELVRDRDGEDGRADLPGHDGDRRDREPGPDRA